jgi:hypothetical protein
MRNDTPYWQQVSEQVVYAKDMLDFEPVLSNGYQDLAYRIHRSNVFGNDMSGIVYIAAGMGYNPVYESKVDFLDIRYMESPEYWEKVYADWQNHREKTVKHVGNLPTHYEFLKQHIHK